VPAYRKFESISLQRGVHCEPEFPGPIALSWRGFGDLWRTLRDRSARLRPVPGDGVLPIVDHHNPVLANLQAEEERAPANECLWDPPPPPPVRNGKSDGGSQRFNAEFAAGWQLRPARGTAYQLPASAYP
jgi:hypothetical protein